MQYKDNNRIPLRYTVFAGLLAASIILFGACSKHSSSSAAVGRSYRMGFMSSAPRPDFNLYIQSLHLWTTHSDATIISTEVPWDSLLNGENATAYVVNNYLGLVSYCRSLNLKLWVYIDPANGLDRASDSRPLLAKGRSISEPAIQQVYRRFVVVMDSILHPDHLGLALETNLIRIAAPASIYQGVRTAANAAATEVRAIDPHVPLSISVQAEVAWGKLNGSGVFVGVAQDFTDFPFLQELGISSYPYLGYSTPAAIPVNYYSQLVADHAMPVFVSEGGWTSGNLSGNGFSIIGSPALQAAYIQRQGQLLAQARGIGLFQLTFTDLDLSAWPAADSVGLVPFAFLGMVDNNFAPKPALTSWDSLKTRPLLP
jgi:hypothetical protein